MSKKIKSISKLKLADLRKLAKKLGVEDWDTLETRKEMIDAIKAVQEVPEPSEESAEPEPEEEEEPEEEPKGLGAGIEEKRTPVGGKAEIMKRKLAKQEKVTILIPREGKEKAGTTFSVCLNGYRLNIQKGVYVEVPRQVADVVMEHFNQTNAADMSLVRKDGKPMKIEGGSEPALEE